MHTARAHRVSGHHARVASHWAHASVCGGQCVPELLDCLRSLLACLPACLAQPARPGTRTRETGSRDLDLATACEAFVSKTLESVANSIFVCTNSIFVIFPLFEEFRTRFVANAHAHARAHAMAWREAATRVMSTRLCACHTRGVGSASCSTVAAVCHSYVHTARAHHVSGRHARAARRAHADLRGP